MPSDPLVSGVLERLPELYSTCYDIGRALHLADAFEITPRQIVFAASGLSALAAEGFQALALAYSKTPILVSSGYHLPAFVGSETFVVAISPSGTTQEVIYALSDADERKARVLVLTGPRGHVREIAEAQGYPILSLPDEILQHSASEYGAVFWMLLGALSSLIHGSGADPSSASDTLRLLSRQRTAFGPIAPSDTNAARQVANALGNTWPIFYGSSAVAAAAARSWAELFAASARVPSLAFAFPDLDHDRELPWLMPSRLPFSLVILRDQSDDSLVRDRIDALRNRWDDSSSNLTVHEIFADGETPLARLWTAIVLGIWTARYLENS